LPRKDQAKAENEGEDLFSKHLSLFIGALRELLEEKSLVPSFRGNRGLAGLDFREYHSETGMGSGFEN